METTWTTWFVEPLNARTNDVLVQYLQDGEEDTLQAVTVADGSRRNLWRLSFRELRMLEANRKDLGLAFSILRRRGTGGLYDVTRFVRSRLLRTQAA